MREKPPTERSSFLTSLPLTPLFSPIDPLPPCALSSWPSHLSQALHLQLSHSVRGCNYSCPSPRLSLNNGIPRRPRSRYDSLSKFDFSSHLHSINSAICLILYLNCSSGCQDSVCLGKGRGTVLEKLHWWMTGEIGRDVRVVGGKNSKPTEEKREKLHSSIIYFFYCCLFVLAQRKLLSGESKRFPVLLLLFLSLGTTELNTVIFLLSFPWVAWGLLCFSPLPACDCSSTSFT